MKQKVAFFSKTEFGGLAASNLKWKAIVKRKNV